jgi:aspartyl-tRNA(Asn)/glutamyl-tRNA(Gln) amidotransferase subunit C
MTVSKEQITQVAKLSRLALSETELVQYTAELDKILGYIERLNTVNTKDVEPMIYATVESTPTREDVVEQSETIQNFRETFLEMAPQSEGRFFKVPKISE